MASKTVEEICDCVTDTDCSPNESSYRKWAIQLLCSINTNTAGGGITDNVNLAQINGTSTAGLIGNGAAANTLRVTIANDSTGVLATVSTVTNLAQMAGQAIAMGTGVRTAGTQRVTLATDDVIPLPTGAATAALQTTGNTSLASIDTKTPALGQQLAAASSPVVLTAAQISTLTPLATVAVTQSTSPWVVSGTVAFSNTTIAVTNAGTFATQSTLQAGSAIIGKVAIDQTTPGTTNGVQINAALPAGTALIGKVGIDQTTVGTTNAVSLAQLGANTIATGNGASSTGVLRVAQVNDGTGVLAGVTTVTTVTTVSTLTGTTTLTPGTGATNLGKAEDAAAVSGDTGVFILGVRRDTLTTSAGNGDYNELAVDKYGAQVVLQEAQLKTTYSSTFGFSPAASATDVVVLVGSATKTVSVTKIELTGIQTTVGPVAVLLAIRSTDDTGGTSTNQAIIPNDSNNAAATAVVRAYTANPTTGTLVGYVKRNYTIWAQSTSAQVTELVWTFGDQGQPLVLRGTSQIMAINIGGVTVTGNTILGSIEWTEE